MSKFVNKENKSEPKVSTAALPDIVFMLLFYFMVAASIKSSNFEQFISVKLPKGQELSKVKANNLVNYIYVGIPKNSAKYGNSPNMIVANDKIITLGDIPTTVAAWRKNIPPQDYVNMKTMINVHYMAKLAIVQEIEDQLGRSNLPKIVYAGSEGNPNDNFKQR